MSFAFCPRARGVASFSAPLRFGVILLNALATADALDDCAVPDDPPWPPAGSRITKARAEALLARLEGDEPIECAVTVGERRAYEGFSAERDRWRSTASADPKRIAAYKFRSNDGWIVTPAEAKVIAEALGSVLSDEYSFELLCDILEVGGKGATGLRDGLERFRAFNAKCAKRAGYSVD